MQLKVMAITRFRFGTAEMIDQMPVALEMLEMDVFMVLRWLVIADIMMAFPANAQPLVKSREVFWASLKPPARRRRAFLQANRCLPASVSRTAPRFLRRWGIPTALLQVSY